MTEWEKRRIESVIGGDAGREALDRTATRKSVSDDWRDQPIVRPIRRPRACETSQSGRFESSGPLFANLANQGTHDRVGGPASPTAVQMWRDDDAWVVVVEGELDLAVVETVRAALGRAMSEPRPRLIVDLSGLSFIDSSGVHTILDAYRRCRSAGPALTIRPGPPNVQQVFELTNTLSYLPFESNT